MVREQHHQLRQTFRQGTQDGTGYLFVRGKLAGNMMLIFRCQSEINGDCGCFQLVTSKWFYINMQKKIKTPVVKLEPFSCRNMSWKIKSVQNLSKLTKSKFHGKIKNTAISCGVYLLLWQGMRESNSHQRFGDRLLTSIAMN